MDCFSDTIPPLLPPPPPNLSYFQATFAQLKVPGTYSPTISEKHPVGKSSLNLREQNGSEKENSSTVGSIEGNGTEINPNLEGWHLSCNRD